MKKDIFYCVVNNVDGYWLEKTKFFEKYEDEEIIKWLIMAYKRTLGRGTVNAELEIAIVEYFGKDWFNKNLLTK